MKPYYADESVTLYHGDCREIDLPTADLIVTDPPYGETSLDWDVWPDRWPELMPGRSLWCFGSMRMFLARTDDFATWQLSQDVIWEKPRMRGTHTDRFARIHEHVTHWYRGKWADVYTDAQRVPYYGKRVHVPSGVSDASPGSRVRAGRDTQAYVDDGTRLMGTILRGVAADPRRALHPTQKPVEVLDPLIRYGCPLGGLVLDPFAGSGSTGIAAAAAGRRAVLIEADERYCEVAARRLSQGVLDFGSDS